MEIDVESVSPRDWEELAVHLRDSGYATRRLKEILDLPDSVPEIIKNIGRYSLFHNDELAEIEGPFPVLARLFMLCGHVSAAEIDTLDPSLAQLLRRTKLIVAVEGDAQLLRATAVLTEIQGRIFLSDRLFENTGTDFLVHATPQSCMPPHASSLELLDALRRPAGATSFLDVGCGSGCQSLLFATDYARIAGFDPGTRQVAFARANAHLNGVDAEYVVDRWETFPPERFDHVAFNSPDPRVAFDFINAGLDHVLADGGYAQVWLSGERLAPERDWAEHVARRLTGPGDWRIDVLVHTDSPFALTPHDLAAGALPEGTLLVDHPAKEQEYLDGLRERGAAEVSSLTLTISRR
ncbi:class I SAM-dependent methyltransferase [Actinoplanes teichomyceticus]|uniref:Methyltransferase family protein n=1 Tax=Actinoplanes teichomyceticus TaxID=1867 RepID=A0A561WK28_ACTTI|nr:class I SAM-dependent methyltransferase [Actinoplanes teichomyceticus]TWG24208.1 methyltransferase family protein [Actinoplanes teichomyceticus]GIF12945.1 hypothetical protein Ate01nite_29770 [Actinoplanes teichomyceticus]